MLGIPRKVPQKWKNTEKWKTSVFEENSFTSKVLFSSLIWTKVQSLANLLNRELKNQAGGAALHSRFDKPEDIFMALKAIASLAVEGLGREVSEEYVETPQSSI
eukprot:1366597-Amphidinium_carterae.1